MKMNNTHSLRVHYRTWSDAERCREQLEWLREFRDTIDEVAFFTGDTHPPLPLVEVRRRAALLHQILPDFKALGLRVGINHLATIGHLDENPENSLDEPWQHLVDLSGAVSASCYCAADPAVQTYIRDCYAALAAAAPEFIWIDDDVRLESHPKSIAFACFCPRCLAEFAAETGATWAREPLLAAFKDNLDLRRHWLEHSRRYVTRILQLARTAVDSVRPGLRLGFMTGEIPYSGYGYEAWREAMAGAQRLDVKFRPGGGFYTDESPTALLGKCHSVGRQNAFVPAAVTDIQYEHENFPYLVLNKSRAVYTAEIAGAIAAGCTGVALNTLGISGDPIQEYRPYFETVRSARPFFDELVATVGRSACEGMWPAFGPDHAAALGPAGVWPGPGSWGGDFHALNELFTLGLPAAYTRRGAAVTILAGDSVLEWSTPQLQEMLAGAVILDGAAVQRLMELGLVDLAGWEIAGTGEVDMIERFTADPLNGRFAGWHRDCRPSFWPRTTYLLRPVAATARPLAEAQDFKLTDHGCCSGVFENRCGGRVFVGGYYPWHMLGSLAKSSQLRNVARWLSRERLPAYVESYHRIALWCRRDSAGRPAFVLINASIDPADGVVLKVRDLVGPCHALDLQGRRTTLPVVDVDSPYQSLHLPPLPPWSALLVHGPGHCEGRKTDKDGQDEFPRTFSHRHAERPGRPGALYP